MKLVIEYTIEGDGCETVDRHHTIPAEYESAEAFLIKLQEILERQRDAYLSVRDLVVNIHPRKASKEDQEQYSSTTRDIYVGFELGGQILRLDMFWPGMYSPNISSDIKLPNVFELNEWHETRIRESVS